MDINCAGSRGSGQEIDLAIGAGVCDDRKTGVGGAATDAGKIAKLPIELPGFAITGIAD
jgi:hypothetical protein